MGVLCKFCDEQRIVDFKNRVASYLTFNFKFDSNIFKPFIFITLKMAMVYFYSTTMVCLL